MLLPPEEASLFISLYSSLIGFAAGCLGGVAGSPGFISTIRDRSRYKRFFPINNSYSVCFAFLANLSPLLAIIDCLGLTYHTINQAVNFECEDTEAKWSALSIIN